MILLFCFVVFVVVLNQGPGAPEKGVCEIFQKLQRHPENILQRRKVSVQRSGQDEGLLMELNKTPPLLLFPGQ